MIIDACLFAGEAEMLELRLRTLAPVVDAFVVVACTRTHQGEPVDREAIEHASGVAVGRAGVALAFSWFEPEMFLVQHGKTFRRPAGERGPVGSPWYQKIEKQHRDGCLAAVRQVVPAGEDPVVMISDVDEIPDPAKVERLEWPNSLGPHGRVCFQMRFHSWGLDLLSAQQPWPGTTASRLSRCQPQADRDARTTIGNSDQSIDVIRDAGWHLSWLGTPAEHDRKLATFSHAELAGVDLRECEAEATDTNGLPLKRLWVGEVRDLWWPEPMVDGSFKVPDAWWFDGPCYLGRD